MSKKRSARNMVHPVEAPTHTIKRPQLAVQFPEERRGQWETIERAIGFMVVEEKKHKYEIVADMARAWVEKNKAKLSRFGVTTLTLYRSQVQSLHRAPVLQTEADSDFMLQTNAYKLFAGGQMPSNGSSAVTPPVGGSGTFPHSDGEGRDSTTYRSKNRCQ